MRKVMFLLFRGLTRKLKGMKLSRLKPLGLFYWLILSKLRPDLIEVEGNKIFLDKMDSLSLSVFGTYYREGFTTNVFKGGLKAGNVVLDIGAHIGYYTLLAAKIVGNKGKVFAFEPDSTNFNLLKKNVEINNYKNIVLVNKAVSNKTGKTKLFFGKSSGTHSIVPRNSDYIKIDSVRLDDYFRYYREKIDFVKVDVEGAELKVLEGMLPIVRNNNLKLISEFFPNALRECKVKPEDYLKLLFENFSKIYYINEEDKKLQLQTKINKIMKICSTKNYVNLLCVK